MFSELADLLTAGNDFKGLILKKLQIKNQTIRKEYNNIQLSKTINITLLPISAIYSFIHLTNRFWAAFMYAASAKSKRYDKKERKN